MIKMTKMKRMSVSVGGGIAIALLCAVAAPGSASAWWTNGGASPTVGPYAQVQSNVTRGSQPIPLAWKATASAQQSVNMGVVSMTLTPNLSGSYGQGSQWTLAINTNSSTPLYCSISQMYYYEGYFSSPPTHGTDIGSGNWSTFAGNQGYWFNGAATGCYAWRKNPLTYVWEHVFVNLPAYSVYVFETAYYPGGGWPSGQTPSLYVYLNWGDSQSVMITENALGLKSPY